MESLVGILYNLAPPCFLEAEPGPASFSHIQLIASLAAPKDPREGTQGAQ